MGQSTESTNDRVSHSGWGIHLVAALVVFVPLAVVLFPVLAFISDTFGGPDEPAVITPSDSFSQLTGWQLPDDASSVKNINSHSGFKNDGDYILIVSMSESQLATLLETDTNTWLECPVDPKNKASSMGVSRSLWHDLLCQKDIGVGY